MPSATVTSKGQITIPKEIRDQLHVQAGDRIAFRVREDGAVVLEVENLDLRDLRGALKLRRAGVTLTGMDQDIRRHAAEADRRSRRSGRGRR